MSEGFILKTCTSFIAPTSTPTALSALPRVRTVIHAVFLFPFHHPCGLNAFLIALYAFAIYPDTGVCSPSMGQRQWRLLFMGV